MDSGRVIRGLPVREALWRLLELRGIGTAQAQSELEAFGQDPSEPSMLQVLERCNLHGRWAAVPVRDLLHADLPTLAAGSDGTWLVLCARRGSKLHVEGALEEGWLGPDALEGAYLGRLLDLQDQIPSGGIWRTVPGLILRRAKDLYPIAGLAILVQLLTILTPQWTRILVDQVFPATALSLFKLVVIASLLQATFRAWLDWLQGRFSMILENRLSYTLERGMLSKIFSLPFLFFQGRTLGELLQGLHGLVAAKEYLMGKAFTVLLNALSAVFFLLLMCSQLPGPAGFVVLMALASTMFNILVALRIARLEGQVVEASARQWSYLVELFNGLPTLKVSGVESTALDRWLGLYWLERVLGLHANRIGLWSRSVIAFGSLLQGQFLNIWCALTVLDGRLELGAMLAFTMMAGAFQSAIGELGNLYIQFVFLKPQIQRTREILGAAPEPLPCLPSGKPFRAWVKVEDLSFRYGRDDPWIFQDFKLEVAEGEKHRIPGPSGAGKSTLLRILAGLLVPETGHVRLGGLTPRDVRRHLAYLPQGIRLFQGSIMENLGVYSCGAARGRILETAFTTGLASMVEKLPMGWDTWVSLGGGNFSGGQRQLIALTGVLASERPLLLLDEALANLDPIRQEQLLRDPLFNGKTIIYACHGIAFPASA